MDGVHCLRNLSVLDDECINRIKKHQARPPTAAGSAAANQSRPHKPPSPPLPLPHALSLAFHLFCAPSPTPRLTPRLFLAGGGHASALKGL